MKWINYTNYNGDDLGISAEDLLKALSDFFLQSGFDIQYMQFSEMNQQSLEDLKEAIERALRDGNMFDQSQAEQMPQQIRADVAGAVRSAGEPAGAEAGRGRLHQLSMRAGGEAKEADAARREVRDHR